MFLAYSYVKCDKGRYELTTLPEHTSPPPVCSGVRVIQSLVLYVCFVDRCLPFCSVSFVHCVVWSASIYGFWLLRLVSSSSSCIITLCFSLLLCQLFVVYYLIFCTDPGIYLAFLWFLCVREVVYWDWRVIDCKCFH